MTLTDWKAHLNAIIPSLITAFKNVPRKISYLKTLSYNGINLLVFYIRTAH